jgi:hypothetical protein
MVLLLSLKAHVEFDLVTGSLALFLMMFLLCVCIGLVGTYRQWQRDLDWEHAERVKQEAGRKEVYQ